MGRNKLKVEIIEDLGARMQKFKKQKEGLTTKFQELMTLCDIEAGMAIYDPIQNQSFVFPNVDQLRRLNESYRRRITEVKSFGVSEYFAQKKKKVEADLLKLRKDKYPTWNEGFDSMNEAELRGLGDALHTKSQMIRSILTQMQDPHQLELERLNSADHYYNFNNQIHHHQFLMNPATATVPVLPQMNNYYYKVDDDQNQKENQYYYNVDDDDEKKKKKKKKNNMMLGDGLVGSLELPYTNIAFSAEDMDSWSWGVMPHMSDVIKP